MGNIDAIRRRNSDDTKYKKIGVCVYGYITIILFLLSNKFPFFGEMKRRKNFRIHGNNEGAIREFK